MQRNSCGSKRMGGIYFRLDSDCGAFFTANILCESTFCEQIVTYQLFLHLNDALQFDFSLHDNFHGPWNHTQSRPPRTKVTNEKHVYCGLR